MSWRLLPLWHTLELSDGPGGAAGRPATGSYCGVPKAQGCAQVCWTLARRQETDVVLGCSRASLKATVTPPMWSVLCPESPSPRFLSPESHCLYSNQQQDIKDQLRISVSQSPQSVPDFSCPSAPFLQSVSLN